MSKATRSVFVAIVGKPNVGKSSLLNRLVGEKVAIVTSKPQTTRTRITGILTKGAVQYVFLDTPGMHRPRTKLGGRMTKTVKDTLADGDSVAMLFDPVEPLNSAEKELVEAIQNGSAPAVAVVNKADTVQDSAVWAQTVAELEALQVFKQVGVVSAAEGTGCEELLEILQSYAVEGPHYFTEDAYTDLPEKQLVAEIIREKILIYMSQEIPHGTAVEIERFREREDKPIIDIEATIFCEKKTHKGMIIGKGGQMLKTIASEARQDCEEMLGNRVNLQCWVKVKDDWRDNDFLLNNFGFKSGK
ncbi:MAG: GTPase Era [Oscillospiraceae bacterium]